MIKTRLSDEEYLAFLLMCKRSRLSQSEFLRKVLTDAKVEVVIRAGGVNSEFLDLLNVTNREIARVGTNLNQIALKLNTSGEVSSSVVSEIRDCIGELTDLKFSLLKKAGETIGNDKAYRL